MASRRSTVYDMFKRIADIVFSAVLLVVLSPVLVATALLVLFSMGKPVFFIQKRPGLNSRIFHLIKFRTMMQTTGRGSDVDASATDDVRLTRVGLVLRKLSLDELPELINILIGDMSFVGPRPLLVEYLPLYSVEQARRHEVRPGLTGLAQVSGRNNLDWPDRFRLDVEYVDNRSLLLDCKILWRTVGVTLGGHGVEAQGQVTSEPFRGNTTSDN